MEQAVVSAVVHDTSEAKVTLGGVPDKPGIAARVFRVLADADVNVDMIVLNVSDHGVTDISFTVPRTDLEAALGAALIAPLRSGRFRFSKPCGTQSRHRSRRSMPFVNILTTTARISSSHSR